MRTFAGKMLPTVTTVAVLSLELALTGCGLVPRTTISGAVAPTFLSISPTSGNIDGGSTITLQGTAFRPGATVLIGGEPCTEVTLNGTTELSCTTPPHAAGVVDIEVTSTGKSSTLTGAFLYFDSGGPIPAPELTSVSPSSGYTTGVTAITISGRNFITGMRISVDGAECDVTKVLSATSATCRPAEHPAGLVGVAVQNPDTQFANLDGGYTYVAAPTYTQLKASFLTGQCSACHGGNGDLFVLNHASLSQFAIAGSPLSSALYQAVANDRMPSGAAPLSANQKQQLFDWIAAGARDD